MSKRFGPIVLALTLAASTGCDARIGGVMNENGGGDDTQGGIDANEGSGSIDAPAMTTIDAPACFNGRVVYLNFNGATLTRATPSDATADRASWVGRTDGRTTGTVPRYRSNDANRQTQIDTIIANVRAGLSQFPVTVVTDRPAAGPYVMVVFGGVNTDLGTPYTIATNQLDCGDVNKSDVAWVSDTTTSAKVDDYAIGAIGFGLGLTATAVESDCMCGWANDCRQPDTSQCTLTPGPIARDQTGDPELLCPGLTTQDEVATFEQAFCN